MSSLFCLWVMLTFIVLAVVAGLDSAFGRNTELSFLDAGFVAFVLLWCRIRAADKEISRALKEGRQP